MFDFLKGTANSGEIKVGSGLNSAGRGIISFGNMVAGAGAHLQANGWARKLAMADIIVTAVSDSGKEMPKVTGRDALMRHFSNFAKRVKFEAADEENAAAVSLAATFQAEFDKRSDAAAAELSNLIAKPKPANVTAKPATKVKTKPATADPETDDPDTAAVAAVAEEEKRSSDKEAKSLVARFKALDDDALAGCC